MGAWHLDFFDPAATLGGFLRVLPRPRQRRVEFWACLLGADRNPVVVLDRDLPLPPAGLELRGGGLWVEVSCLVPYEHVTVQLEAFGAGLDRDEPAHPDMRGERVPLGFDLEWECDPLDRVGDEESYVLPCVVHGEILVGSERIDFDGDGVWRFGPDLDVANPGARDGEQCMVWAKRDDGCWVLGEPGTGGVEGLRIQRQAPDSDLVRRLGRVQTVGGSDATGWIECSQFMKES